jgi:hypothetical protein
MSLAATLSVWIMAPAGRPNRLPAQRNIVNDSIDAAVRQSVQQRVAARHIGHQEMEDVAVVLALAGHQHVARKEDEPMSSQV